MTQGLDKENCNLSLTGLHVSLNKGLHKVTEEKKKQVLLSIVKLILFSFLVFLSLLFLGGDLSEISLSDNNVTGRSSSSDSLFHWTFDGVFLTFFF